MEPSAIDHVRHARSVPNRGRTALIGVIVALFVAAFALAVTTGRAEAASQTLWDDSAVPEVLTDPDSSAVTLGVAFVPAVAGQVTAIRFFKGPENTGTHLGQLWSSDGSLLSEVRFTNETAQGWQQANLSAPVTLAADETYVVSYHAPDGGYSVTEGYFLSGAVTTADLSAPASTLSQGNGLYRYGSPGFPSDTFRGSNYWVDVVFTAGSSAPATPPVTVGTEQTLWNPTSVPVVETDPDRAAVELGVRFSPSVDGLAQGVQFYKGRRNTGTHTGRLWTAKGELLAEVTFTRETARGWQRAEFDEPVELDAGNTYVVSYHAPRGRYAVTERYFSGRSHTRGDLTAASSETAGGNGVFAYGAAGSFPDESYQGSNYWVDVIFTATSVGAPAPAPSAVASTTAPAPVAPSPAQSPTTAAPTAPAPPPAPTTAAPAPPVAIPSVPAAGSGAPRVALGSPVTVSAPDGGTNYLAGWPNSLPNSPSYFPLGVWFESVSDQGNIDKDRDAGLNLYVALTANSDLGLVERAGMHVLGQQEEWVGRSNSRALAGWVLYDEIDMIQGPSTGYATMDQIVRDLPRNDGRIRYNNYGKGIMFWETDAQASRFVNNYQDLISADTYYFTDPFICGPSEGGALLNNGNPLSQADCRLAANYGATVDRVRYLDGLDGKRQPVWNFVEVGHPFSENDAPTIKPAELRAAVWSGIIHGARGVVYFNHSFGGPCLTQHALRESCYSAVRAEVKRTNAQITALAPVLNAYTVNGLVSTTGQVDTMTKFQGGSYYVFAGSAQRASQSAQFNAPCVGNATVTVVGENRTLPMTNGRFTDTFADGNAVHIYRIDGGSTCGLSS